MTKEDNQPFDSVYWRLTNFFEKKSEETKTEEEETKTEEEETKTKEEEETKTKEEEETKTKEEEETKTKEEEETKTEFGFCEDNTTKKLNQDGTNCKEYLYKGLIGLFQKKTD